MHRQDSMTPAEWRIDSILSSNNNSNNKLHTLAVQVLRWCDGSYLVSNNISQPVVND